MSMMRMSVFAAVLASAVAAAGCDAASFTALNQTFTTAKKGAVALSDTALPAAAIATSLGAIELLKALSSDSKALVSSGGGNLKGSSAGVISAGAGNLVPRFAVQDANVHDEDIANAKLKVQMHVTYSSTTDPSTGATTSSITSFKGNSQGYDITAQGSFTYAPGAARGANVSAQMTGAVSYKDLKLSIKKLSFQTSDPLPDNAELGAFTFEKNEAGKVSSSIDAKLAVQNGKISASGTSTDAAGITKPLSFDQDNPTGASAKADASASAGGQ